MTIRTAHDWVSGRRWIRDSWAMILCLWTVSAATIFAQSPTVVYRNDFESAAVDSVPDDMLILNGAFVVRADQGNKFLELPGSPLETFAVLFGPSETHDVTVSARIFGSSKGRRFPAYGIGLNGVAGYRMVLAPAKRRVELYRGEEVVSFQPLKWSSDLWWWLKLEVLKQGDTTWRIRGKAWPDGQPEPESWLLMYEDRMEPFAGNASVWGEPYSGLPIRYDDLKVSKME